MVVTEKHPDIAILRTLGASPAQIMRLFIVQGVIIGLVGTGLGVVTGVITALNPAAKEITISVSTAAGAKPMVMTFAAGATLRRYAQNSVKFSDAQPSRYEELKVGDQIKALGTSNEDRSRYTAEEIVSGSFRTIAATVVSSGVIETCEASLVQA